MTPAWFNLSTRTNKETFHWFFVTKWFSKYYCDWLVSFNWYLGSLNVCYSALQPLALSGHYCLQVGRSTKISN